MTKHYHIWKGRQGTVTLERESEAYPSSNAAAARNMYLRRRGYDVLVRKCMDRECDQAMSMSKLL